MSLAIVHLSHKNGGKISALTAIEHSTYKGIATWEFRGVVAWDDGACSPDARIAPYAVCADGTNRAAELELRAVMALLNDYLMEHGQWGKLKDGRDGWIATAKTGRKDL